MKKYIVLIMITLSSLIASASNYPPSFFEQNVNTYTEGPALIAYASSGSRGSLFAFGYRNSHGILPQSDSIDAHVIINCSTYQNRQTVKFVKVITLGKEWNGTGYLSYAIQKDDLLTNTFNTEAGPVRISCDTVNSMEVAFTTQGQWDSQYGRNYKGTQADSFKAGSAGSGINQSGWDFIIRKMRE